jgi:hypothetical protein
MAFQMFDKCKLHIPHKEWAIEENLPGAMKERDNYAAIEQWSQGLADCFGSCTCSVEQWLDSATVDENSIATIPRPDVTSQLCGTTNTEHMMIVNVNVFFQGVASPSGDRDVQILGNGELTSIHGMTVPGSTAWDGQQRISVTRFFPSHLNSLSPKYNILLWQNGSGMTLNYSVEVEEYYPCCNCDWPYGC